MFPLVKISLGFVIEEVENKINGPMARELFLAYFSCCICIVGSCSVKQNDTSYEIHLVTIFIWLLN